MDNKTIIEFAVLQCEELWRSRPTASADNTLDFHSSDDTQPHSVIVKHSNFYPKSSMKPPSQISPLPVYNIPPLFRGRTLISPPLYYLFLLPSIEKCCLSNIPTNRLLLIM